MVDTVSASSRELHRLVRKWGMPENRIFDVPVGAELDVFHPDNNGDAIRKRLNLNGPVIVYIGQMELGVYAGQILDAAPLILAEKPDASFVLAGAGPKIEELKARLMKEEWRDRVLLLGARPAEEIPYILAAADVAVATFEDN